MGFDGNTCISPLWKSSSALQVGADLVGVGGESAVDLAVEVGIAVVDEVHVLGLPKFAPAALVCRPLLPERHESNFRDLVLLSVLRKASHRQKTGMRCLWSQCALQSIAEVHLLRLAEFAPLTLACRPLVPGEQLKYVS